jgi:hypothetical protein
MQSGDRTSVDTLLVTEAFYDIDSTKIVLSSAGLYLPPDSELKSRKYRWQLIAGQKKLVPMSSVTSNYCIRNFEGFSVKVWWEAMAEDREFYSYFRDLPPSKFPPREYFWVMFQSIRPEMWRRALKSYQDIESKKQLKKFSTSVDNSMLNHITDLQTNPAHAHIWQQIRGKSLLSKNFCQISHENFWS